MINKGWKYTTIDENGNYRPTITNEELYKITKQQTLEDFIDKSFMKYQSHICRLPNSNLQKKLQNIIPEVKIYENIWSKCKKLLGGTSEEQARRTMFDKSKIYSELDKRFG